MNRMSKGGRSRNGVADRFRYVTNTRERHARFIDTQRHVARFIDTQRLITHT